MTFKFDLVTARLFLAIAERGSIAAAARHENIAASAISKRVGELEKLFGLTLLRRHPGGVELTPAGSIMLRRARNLVQEAVALEEELSVVGRSIEGHIRLAANETALIGFVPQLLKGFLADHPGIRIDLDERMSPEVTRDVQYQFADIGIFVGETKIQDLWVQTCFRDRIVLVTARDHPLGGLPGVTLPELLEHELIGQDRRAGLQLIEGRAARLGRQIRTRTSVDGYDIACSLAAQGLGVAIVAEASARIFAKAMNLSVLPLLEPWALREHKVCVRAPLDTLGAAPRMLLDRILSDRLAGADRPL